MEDSLVIGFDHCPPNIATLVVARKKGEKLVVINRLWDSEAADVYLKLISNKSNYKGNAKKRKYNRKCGICGERYEQSEMLRTNNSPNGWLCWDCNNIVEPEYDD